MNDESIMNLVKSYTRSISRLHGVNGFINLLLLVCFIGGGFIFYKKVYIKQERIDNELKLLNQHYVLQNQTTILLKVIDSKLRNSSGSAFGSATIEEKVQTAKMMYDMSSLKKVPLHILCGIAEVESTWNTKAISSAGCMGLIQVTPMYARSHLREKGITYKQDIWFDAPINIMCGVSMLADYHEEHIEKGRTTPDNWTLAIHTYFWGPYNTEQLFGKKDQRVNVPNMAYPMKVIEASKKYKEMGL